MSFLFLLIHPLARQSPRGSFTTTVFILYGIFVFLLGPGPELLKAVIVPLSFDVDKTFPGFDAPYRSPVPQCWRLTCPPQLPSRDFRLLFRPAFFYPVSGLGTVLSHVNSSPDDLTVSFGRGISVPSAHPMHPQRTPPPETPPAGLR